MLILPSRNEPWGFVINEAIWAGLPIIASDKVGCHKELVGNNGIIFSHNDKFGLYEAIMDIKNNYSEFLRGAYIFKKKIVKIRQEKGFLSTVKYFASSK